MPLLAAEPIQYPDNLFETPDPPSGAKWWVLHTRPRAEKAIARALFRQSVPFFLPLYEQSRRVGGRQQKSHLPLFPGYLFLRSDEEGRVRALETNQVASSIPVKDPVVLQVELAAVQQAISSGAPIGPASHLTVGSVVGIVNGPLAGLRGKVTSWEGKLRLVLEVRLLNQGVSVEIETWMVESLPYDPTVARAP